MALGATLFGQMSLTACAEWLWSGLPVRYPELQDRHERGGHRLGGHAARPPRQHRRPLGLRAGLRPVGTCVPAEVLHRNFWFCTIDDPSTIDTRHRIGIDHIMVEVDYPHGDSTWPDTQAVIERCWGHLPEDELRKLTHENAARPLPLAPARRPACRDQQRRSPRRPRALLPDLTPREELVLLARTLWREGYDDHLAGHITYRQPDGTLLCNPWLLLWEELRPEDVLRHRPRGQRAGGRMAGARSGIPLHLELHRQRPRT